MGTFRKEVSGDTMYKEGFRYVSCAGHRVGWGGQNVPRYTWEDQRSRG